MSAKEFTLDDLLRILRAAAGADEAVDLGGDILDAEFESLGYESLALLETASRIEREFRVSLDDDLVTVESTPRQLMKAVNERLSAA